MTWKQHLVADRIVVDPLAVSALSALLDDGLPAVSLGDWLPPLWHWVALPRWTPSSTFGADGHPIRGDLLPPIDLPRRMFAGGAVSFHAPIRVGSVVRRERAVTGVKRKAGRTGQLVVVTLTTRLLVADRLAVEETQNLIYRDASQRAPRPAPMADLPPRTPLQRTGDWAWSFHTNPSLLMRFSAATANAHRIHYDHPYATQVEGYPALVVHGPLMTVTLAEVARLEGVARIRSLSHRNLAPLYCGTPASIRRLSSSDRRDVSLQLRAPDGSQETTRTTLTLRVA